MDKAYHLVLPIATLVITSIGALMRHTRTNMLEVLNADYIRTARAKGLSEQKVIYKHAFRNTLIPLVTIIGGSLPGRCADYGDIVLYSGNRMDGLSVHDNR
jgi:peptide/nickel transport system permease protein